MNLGKSVVPPRELRACMSMHDVGAFLNSFAPVRHIVFVTRDHANSQKWTISVFSHPSADPIIRDLWVGASEIPAIKHLIQDALFVLGFSVMSGLIKGENQIWCFARPTPQQRKTAEQKALKNRLGRPHFPGIRYFTEDGFQSNSPGAEIVAMLGIQYGWSGRSQSEAVQHASTLPGPDAMEFIAKLLADHGTPEFTDE